MTAPPDNAAPPLRSAVVGCGAIAYEHLPFLASSPQSKLVGVCDRSAALADAARDRFHVEAAFTDFDAMLAEARPDIVHVLTPPQTHDALVRAALAAGAHVICEKPMTGTAAETEDLLQCAARAGRTLTESRNLLFNDPVIELLRLIRDGRLGDVIECDILLTVDFLSGPFGDRNLSGPAVQLPGGAIHDFLPHLVYAFQALTGISDVEEMHGVLQNRSQNPRAGFDFLDALLYAGSVRGRLRIASDVQPASFTATVRGSRATVETDFYLPGLLVHGPPNVGKRSPLGQIANGRRLIRAGFANFRDKVMQYGPMHGMTRMLDATYSAIRSGGPMPITPEQMIATARLTDRLIALGCQR